MEEIENSNPQGNGRAAWVKQIVIGVAIVLAGLVVAMIARGKVEDVHARECEDFPDRCPGGGGGGGGDVPGGTRRKARNGQERQLTAGKVPAVVVESVEESASEPVAAAAPAIAEKVTQNKPPRMPDPGAKESEQAS
jgi:hypothetical protein